MPIQGSFVQHYYTLGYSIKDTSEDDGKTKERVTKSVVSQLLKAQDRRRQAEAEDQEPENADFITGLSMTLSAVQASTSHLAVSAPMAHNMGINSCSRFHFSHQNVPVLILQLEGVLSGNYEDVVVIVRSMTGEDGKPSKWQDISSNDYIFRPPENHHLCYVQHAMHFSKHTTKSNDTGKCQSRASICRHLLQLTIGSHGSLLLEYAESSTPVSSQESAISDEKEKASAKNQYRFMDGHPGAQCAFLSRLSHYSVPNISLPRDRLCRIRDLEIGSDDGSDDPSDICIKLRNDYAKIALLMGCPLRRLDDICQDGNYWKVFHEFVKQDYRDRVGQKERGEFQEIDFESYPDEDSDLYSRQYCSTGKLAVVKCLDHF